MNVTWFAHDGVGRLTAVTNALNQVTRYEYDEAGNLLRQIDALNRTNHFEYDGLGRRTKRTLPGDQSETFGYDLAGNLVAHTNFNGIVITNQYSAMNWLTNRSSVGGYSVVFGYSASGQRTNMVDASGTTTYAYDLRDRLTNCLNAAGELHYRYDPAGNLTNLWSETADGVNVRYGYDSLNRLKSVTNVVSGTAGLAVEYGFDAVGNLKNIEYGNGVTNLYRYDALNRLTNVVWKLNTTALGDFTYKLSMAGNRTNLSETVSGASRKYAWQHDAVYRLTNETISVTAPTSTLGYSYDDVGNRLSRGGTLGPLGSQTFTYNTNDWLTTDTYDANGSTTASGGSTYQYDVDNRLTNVNSGAVLIAYDGDGNRIKKTAGGVTTWYLVATVNPSGYAQVVEEKTGTTPTTLSRVYTYGHDLINQREAGGTVYYFGYDGHGSTRFLMNGSTVANVFAYDAYGTLIASNATPQTAYLYAGEQYDADLGFYYLRDRYLSAGTGRFWTADRFEGVQSDPLSLHRYLYAHNNPVDGIDPRGRSLILEFALSTSKRLGISAPTVARVIGIGNTISVILFEAATGNTVIIGAGGAAAVGTVTAMSKVQGGIGSWTRLAQALRGRTVGPFSSLKSVLAGTGKNRHHVNPSAVYPNIPRSDGAAIGLQGWMRGTEHHAFHASLREFFRPFQRNGSKEGLRPTNQQVLQAMRTAYKATGEFFEHEIDELIEFAEKEQRAYRYHDGPGGQPPEIPALN